MNTTLPQTMRRYMLVTFAAAAFLQVNSQEAGGRSISAGDAHTHGTDDVDQLLNTHDARIEFTENKGQFSEGVLFRADFPLGQALATREGMLMKAYDAEAIAARGKEGMRIEEEMHQGMPSRPLIYKHKGHGWMMRFENGSPAMTVESRDAHEEVRNYFVGDASRHAMDVKSFQEVWYTNVYRQVDVRYYPAADGALEYDIICKAGSDPGAIAIRMDGIEQMHVNDDGGLVLSTSLGDMVFPAPVVYQRVNGRERNVEASYRVTDGNLLHFTLGEYDRSEPLVIDPIALRWATWVNTNSSDDNHGHCIWVDPNDGAIYVVARVIGTTDQITVGAFDETANGNLEMIVGKYLEPATVGGSGTRVWQTYIGGNNADNPYAMEQGPDGNLYITGYTGSTNFPLLGGPAFTGTSVDQQAQTGDDIFVLKINTAGTSIKSAVVGGNGAEGSYDLRITAAGDVVVCGGTTSTNLNSLNGGTASNTNNGGTDALVFKVNQDLSSLIWMRNYGGSGTDQPTIMAQDNTTGDIFVGGHTTSSNFPTVSPRQSVLGGTQAGFLQRLTSTGATTWSSYFSSAGASSVQILCMEFNTLKTELYFGGLTTGLAASNISASGVLDNSYNNNTDFFVCRMEIDQDFVAATYIGGTGTENNMMGLNTDLNNDVYVFGYSSSTNFPVTALPNTPVQSTNMGESDKTFFKLETDLSALLFSTYYGGSTDDYDPVGERGIKFSNCRIYTIVTAESNNIPLTQGALNTTKLSSSTGIYEPGLVVWANPPDILDNTIIGNQTICSGGTPGDIIGSLPSYVLPTIIRNGATSSYPSLGSTVTFQWQISTDSVNWTNIGGATSQNLLGSQIGVVLVKTFIRRIIGGDACILAGAADQVVTVNINVVTGVVNDALCNGAATGSITATSTGTAPFSYLWSNGQTTQTAINLAAGPYGVTVTDFTNCMASANFVVGQPTAVSGSAQVTDATCANNNGSATASGSGGTPGYSYLWSTSAVGPTLSGVPSGGYSVTITDANQCPFVLPVTIGGTSVPNANAGADTTITCLTGPQIQLNGSSSTSGADFSWSGPGIVSGSGTATPTVNAAGTYTLTVTAPNSCTNTDQVVVSLNTTPPGANAGADQTINCINLSATLTGSSLTGGVTYAWSGPGGFASTDAVVIVSTGGTYTLTVTDPANGCTSTEQVDVVVDNAPPNASASGGVLNCNTPNGIALSGGSTTPGATFSWTGPGGFASTDEDPIVNTPGTYTLTVTNPANGCTNTATAEVTQDIAAPNASAVGGVLNCNTPNGIALNGGSTTPGATFSWSGPGGFANTDEDPIVNAPGTYTLTVTNPANGCTNTATAEVTQDIAAPNASAVGGVLNCNTPNGIALNGGSTTPGATFSWSGPGGFASTDEDPIVNAPGTYTLTVTNPANGCTNTATAEVTQDANVPNATAQGGVLNCNTPNGIALNGGSTTLGVTFSWTGPGGFASTDEDPVVNVPGTYTLTVTNPANGCTNTATAEVTQDIAAPNASAVGGVLNCNTPNGIALNGGSTTPGATFSWSGPGGFASTDEDPMVNVPGTYTLTVTNPANGCTNTASAEVTQDIAAPNSSAVGGVLNCNTPNGIALNGGSTTLGATFSWSGPGGFAITDEDPIVNTPGTYTLTVTNPANGCTNTATAEVTQDIATPNASATGGVLTCGSESGIALNGGSTTLGATFSWSGPGGFTSTDEDPIVNVPGTYTLTVTNPANGCTNTATAEVTQDVNAPDVSAAGGALNCTLTSVMLNGGSTTPGADFSWTGPGGFTSTDEDPVVSTPGIYTLTVTGPNQCSASANAEVTQDIAEPNATAAGGTLNCTTETGIALNGGSTTLGATFAWSGPGGFASTDEDPIVNVAGTYTLTVTGPNGCTATATAVVNEDFEVPEASATGGVLTCIVTSVMLNGSGNGGFSWTGPSGFTSTDEDPIVSVPGIYTLTVTGANGCSASANAEVTQDANVPEVSATGGVLTCIVTSVMLNGSGNGGFSWTGPSGFTSTDEDPIVSVPGIYTLTVTGANGCSASANAEVTQDANVPELSATGGVLTCIVTSVMLNGSGNGGFSWTGPSGFTSTDEDPIVNVPGTYTLTVTAANGCTNSANATVGEDVSAPDVSAEGAVIGCDEAPVQLNGGSTTPGAQFSWSSANGFSSADEDPFVSEVGFYTLTVTGPNGCISSIEVAVTHEDCEDDCGPLIIECGPDTTVSCGTSLDWSVVGGPILRKDKKCPEFEYVSWSDWYSGSCPRILTRTWTVADVEGNVETCVQTITIVDTTAPTLVGVPADVQIDCIKDLPDAPEVWAEDNCKTAWLVDYSEEVIKGKGCVYSIVRTWTATDDCGNTVTAQQTITIEDTVAPEFDCTIPKMKVGCFEIPEPQECVATDNCDEELDYTFTVEKSELDEFGNYTLLWIWTATDDCGNTGTAVQVVYVICGEDPGLDGNGQKAMNASAWPNPFNDGTTISFRAVTTARATIHIFDLSGRDLGRVFDEEVEAGSERTVWFDARNFGEGVYYYELTQGDRSVTGRIIRGR